MRCEFHESSLRVPSLDAPALLNPRSLLSNACTSQALVGEKRWTCWREINDPYRDSPNRDRFPPTFKQVYYTQLWIYLHKNYSLFRMIGSCPSWFGYSRGICHFSRLCLEARSAWSFFRLCFWFIAWVASIENSAENYWKFQDWCNISPLTLKPEVIFCEACIVLVENDLQWRIVLDGP